MWITPVAAARRAIADRVEVEAGHQPFLVVDRQHLAQQRVVRIAMAHPRREAARHPQRELRGGGVRKPAGQVLQAEQFEQFARIADGVAPELAPVPIGAARAVAAGSSRRSGNLGGEGLCGYHSGLEPGLGPQTPYCSRCFRRLGIFLEYYRWPAMA